MPCRSAVISEETYDYITDFPIEDALEPESVICKEEVNDRYNVIYVDNAMLPSLENNFFEYQGIPKLYGLMQIGGDDPIFPQGELVPFDPIALISSGIAQVQGPPLNLTGSGTVICFIDTGIDYTNPVFRDEFGNTRIAAIWDQSDQAGRRPDGFSYGSEYTREQINLALQSSVPWDVVPSRDDNGHGTALASVAAGGSTGNINDLGQIPAGFRGAAPEASLVIVKLKTAKKYLKEYYLIPDQAIAYQENDIMLAVKYCDTFVKLFERPVVICIGIGTAFGDHNGSSPLSQYLNDISTRRNRVVVVCGGNEGNGAGHYRGTLVPGGTALLAGIANAPTSIPVRSNVSLSSQEVTQNVEIRVAEGNQGFFMELWGRRTNVLNVGLRSPGGEVIPPIPLGIRQSITFGFVYERTRVTIYSTLVEPTTGDELIFFRIVNPTPGIWTIQVIGQTDMPGGTFDLWLPLTQFQSSQVYFLSPDPNVTMTEPAMASEVISVSGYQPTNSSFYIDSGRGFTRTNLAKPDLSAPSADVPTVYGKQSGTGFAAALTAGAVSQLLQWAVVEKNNIFVDGRVIKGYLLRGAKRERDLKYPSEEWGYGRLDMTGVFTSLRSMS